MCPTLHPHFYGIFFSVLVCDAWYDLEVKDGVDLHTRTDGSLFIKILRTKAKARSFLALSLQCLQICNSWIILEFLQLVDSISYKNQVKRKNPRKCIEIFPIGHVSQQDLEQPWAPAHSLPSYIKAHGHTGGWDMTTLPDGRLPKDILIEVNLSLIPGRLVDLFCVSTARWSEIWNRSILWKT